MPPTDDNFAQAVRFWTEIRHDVPDFFSKRWCPAESIVLEYSRSRRGLLSDASLGVLEQVCGSLVPDSGLGFSHARSILHGTEQPARQLASRSYIWCWGC